MPPPDKASTSAAAAPKRTPAKSLRGVPRAKSGCYTCRIRRKKCDEQPDEQGRCATCVRLRLECLGFGAKRPEWLRESRTVAEIREKIKVFLASQGMVKGYSGSAHHPFSFHDHAQQYYPSPTTYTLTPSPPTPNIDVHPNTFISTPPQRYKPISFGRGTQHLLNQDDIVPERPRPSTSYYPSTTEDLYDPRCDDSVSDHTFSEVSEGDKTERLISRLEDLFANRCEYKTLLACRGPAAQCLLDMFQRLLDVMYDPPPRFERHLIVATQKLAARSALYPTCHQLSHLSIHDRPVYSGLFFDIFKGVFQGRVICLRMLRLDRTTDFEHFLKSIAKETILWGQLRHPNVLPFYGIYWIKDRVSFIAPWMDHGDITEYLKSHNDSSRVVLSFDVAQGLQFLHKNGIVHGDLKGTNVLVNETGRACLVDYSLAAVSRTLGLGLSAHSRAGSAPWLAPEVFDHDVDTQNDDDAGGGGGVRRCTEAGDVYSWACVAYEIFTSEPPFAHVDCSANAVIARVRAGERPARPPDAGPSWSVWGLTEDIWALMLRCWSADPVRRPTVGLVGEQLEMGLGLLVPPEAEMEMEVEAERGRGRERERERGRERRVLGAGEFRELVRREREEVVDVSVDGLERLVRV